MTERLTILGKEYSSPPYDQQTMEMLTELVDGVKHGGPLDGRIDIPLRLEDGSNELLILFGLQPNEISHVVAFGNLDEN